VGLSLPMKIGKRKPIESIAGYNRAWTSFGAQALHSLKTFVRKKCCYYVSKGPVRNRSALEYYSGRIFSIDYLIKVSYLHIWMIEKVGIVFTFSLLFIYSKMRIIIPARGFYIADKIGVDSLILARYEEDPLYRLAITGSIQV